MLIVAQPTRGLDVGATEFVHGQILAAADRGCAVLLISSELSEIFALSDRIGSHVPRVGFCRIVDRADATEESIGLMMSGEKAAAVVRGAGLLARLASALGPVWACPRRALRWLSAHFGDQQRSSARLPRSAARQLLLGVEFLPCS